MVVKRMARTASLSLPGAVVKVGVPRRPAATEGHRELLVVLVGLVPHPKLLGLNEHDCYDDEQRYSRDFIPSHMLIFLDRFFEPISGEKLYLFNLQKTIEPYV